MKIRSVLLAFIFNLFIFGDSVAENVDASKNAISIDEALST